MKLNEEKSLKGNISLINDYLDKHSLSGSFYNEIDSLKLFSLQDISFENDLKIFNDINFILSVIISIISHPHLSNKGEDIIVKVGQSGALKDDSFKKTIKDARLWKRRNNQMIVEEVYNYVNVDELKIYENVFIVMVIRLIDNQINKYDEFYNSLISVVNDNFDCLSNDKVADAFDKLNFLKNKIRKIKETFFYKEVSKNFKPIAKVQPTNILLKDHLYNLCFKYYKKSITKNEDEVSRHDFKTYFYILLLKALKKNDFKLYPSLVNQTMDKNNIYKSNLSFSKKNYHIGLKYDNGIHGFIFLVVNTDFNKKANRHLLFIDETNNYIQFEKNYTQEFDKEYETCEVISLWNIAYYQDSINKRYYNLVSEEKMMEDYVLDRLLVVEGSHKIYSKYCPICKNKNIDYEDDECTCLSCSSKYNLYVKNNKEYIFFKKVRRLF